MKTKKIEVGNGRFLKIPVIDFKGKVGDEVWWNGGTEKSPFYEHGIIKKLQPDSWWVYTEEDEGGRTVVNPCLGHATVRFDNDSVDSSIPYAYLLLENPEPENPELKEEKVTIPEEFTYQEALQSIIMELDTPIARRKQDEYFNKCVAIVKKKMVEDGIWDGMWSHC